MFCTNCGSEISDNKNFCTNCGAPKVVSSNEPIPEVIPESQPVPEVIPEPQPIPEVIPEPQPVPEVIPEPQPVPEVIPEPQPVPQYIPEPQPMPQYAPAPAPAPKKKKGSIVLKILIPIVLVFSLLFAGGIGAIIYFNSDGYKTKQAIELIIAGNYYEAENKLSGVNTPNATALKEYIWLEKLKDNFIYAAQTDADDTIEQFDALNEAVNNFESYAYNLPYNNFYHKYLSYKYALSYALDISSSEVLHSALYDAQVVMLNEVYRNKSSKYGDSYTIASLQSRVDTSKAAFETLDNYDFSKFVIEDNDVIAYCEVTMSTTDGITTSVTPLSDSFSNMMETAINNCKNEATHSQSEINKSRLSFDDYDLLYLVSPNPYYKAFVADELNEIDSYEDLTPNVYTMTERLKVELAYSLITGSAITPYAP